VGAPAATAESEQGLETDESLALLPAAWSDMGRLHWRPGCLRFKEGEGPSLRFQVGRDEAQEDDTREVPDSMRPEARILLIHKWAHRVRVRAAEERG
jgi:hypothetical protein